MLSQHVADILSILWCFSCLLLVWFQKMDNNYWTWLIGGAVFFQALPATVENWLKILKGITKK